MIRSAAIASLAFAGLAFAASLSAADAAEVALGPVAVSPALAEKLADEYGEREGEVLSREVARALTRTLERRGHDVVEGDAAFTIRVTIIDAKPNKPTFEQLSDRPGLDYFSSIAIGGAKLTAEVVTPGAPARTIEARYYENDLRDVFNGDTWSDARRAIRELADKVADSLPEPPAA